MNALNLEGLKLKAFKGVFTLTFRRLLLKIIDTAGVIFLARALSQDVFGIFGIVSFVVFTFLSFFSDTREHWSANWRITFQNRFPSDLILHYDNPFQ